MKADIQTLRELWRIDDPQYTSNTERGEAIIINQLCDEIEQLRGALEWYAYSVHFAPLPDSGGWRSAASIDAGHRARQALAGEST